jgi:hypothetical protein
MNPETIRAWLGLPDGPWPPDPHTLLGLRPGKLTADLVERRALERMELVRRYQLAHPDEATEAMNRLALALVALTDPSARAAPAPGPTAEVAPPEPEEAPDRPRVSAARLAELVLLLTAAAALAVALARSLPGP